MKSLDPAGDGTLATHAIGIRPEQPRDAAAIRAVLVSAFATDAEARLVEALRAAGHLSVSLVAEDGERIVGHAALSPVTVDGDAGDRGSGKRIGLAPVAVAPDRQREGIGGRLVVAALAAAAAAGADFVVVLGDPAYYGRFGFRAAADWGLSDEYGGGPAFQAVELQVGSIPMRTGLVRYAPEFAVVAG